MAVSTYRTVPFDLSLICMSLPRVTLMNGRMDSGIRVPIFSREFVGRGDFFSKLRRILLFEMWQQWITQREIQVRCEVKNVYCFKFNSFVNCTLGHSHLSWHLLGHLHRRGSGRHGNTHHPPLTHLLAIQLKRFGENEQLGEANQRPKKFSWRSMDAMSNISRCLRSFSRSASSTSRLISRPVIKLTTCKVVGCVTFSLTWRALLGNSV